MDIQKSYILSFVKDFFYFTKSKLLLFAMFTIIFLFYITEQNQVLGIFSYFEELIFIAAIYLFLSIVWFSFKSKRHFIIGLALMVLFISSIFYVNSFYSQKRSEAQAECLRQNNTTVENIEVMKCMLDKGYKKYR